MNRHRKTRQQKVIADLRRKLNAQPESLPAETTVATVAKDERPSYRLEQFRTNLASPIATKRPPITNAFLIHDLRKTGQLTLAIIASEIALYYLLTNHIINIPFIRY